jgi:hypothetical protein
VKESFNEYKSVIESNVIPFTYLYDGDVLSSSDETYTSYINNSNVSPKFIIECIKDIYSKSIDIMIDSLYNIMLIST